MLDIADIKGKIVKGSELEISLNDIMVSQEKLESQMSQMNSRFEDIKNLWELELIKNEKKIYSSMLKSEDLRMLRGDDRSMEVEEFKLGRNDQLIERLKESLKAPHMTSDDVCNLLDNDLYEREKMKQ